MRKCEQQCGAYADVYAGGRGANDWAGYYCDRCRRALNFIVFHVLEMKRQPNDGEQEG